eukprot:CFRG2965T1
MNGDSGARGSDGNDRESSPFVSNEKNKQATEEKEICSSPQIRATYVPSKLVDCETDNIQQPVNDSFGGHVVDPYTHLNIEELKALAEKSENDCEEEGMRRILLQSELADLQVILQSESESLYKDADRRRLEAENAKQVAIKNQRATEEAMKSVQMQETYLRELVSKIKKPHKKNSNLWQNFVNNISAMKTDDEKARKHSRQVNVKTAESEAITIPLLVETNQQWAELQDLLSFHGKGADCVRNATLVRRILIEDIAPCLQSYDMDVSYLVDLMFTNRLQIEPAPLHEQKECVCALSSKRLLCSHRFQVSGSFAKPEHKTWSPLGRPCYRRIAAVGDLITYIRYIGMGINHSSLGLVYQDIVTKILNISAARLGVRRVNIRQE